jgi:hypothetical protein
MRTMKRLALLLVLVSCAEKKLEEEKKANEKKQKEAEVERIKTGCPLPTPANVKVRGRFAVGTGVADQQDTSSGRCNVDFVNDDKVIQMGRVIAEGEFHGGCNGVSNWVYLAVAAAKVEIVVHRLVAEGMGEKGPNKPIVLDYTNRDKDGAWVHSQLVDKCGDELQGVAETKWSNAGCEKIAEVRNVDGTTDKQVMPLGKGTCNIVAERAGMTTTLAVTVK